MRYALIPPIDLLEYTDQTNMQLMLPHLVNDEIYRYVYQQHCDDPEQYVILDNGAAENVLYGTGELLKIAHDFGVDEIVIPDVIKDMNGTLEEYHKFWDYARESRSLRGMKTMFVLQGSTREEFFRCANIATDYHFKAQVIGIPRHSLTTCNDEDIRLHLAAYIREMNPRKEIHLLGGNPDWPVELSRQFRHTARSIRVRSTDTSSPFNYAFDGKILNQPNAGVSRPRDYFEQPYDAFDLDVLEKNLAKLRLWTSEA